MNVERIARNKIKITMSKHELEYYHIDVKSMSYGSQQAREMFMDVMRLAEVREDFYNENSQLVIEASISADSGFAMLITRIDEEDDFENLQRMIKSKVKKVESRKKNILSHTPLVFAFGDFDILVAACKEIEIYEPFHSSLYKYNEQYYLILYMGNAIFVNDVDCILSEFGKKCGFHGEVMVKEHGRCLIPGDAVRILNRKF